MTLRGRLLASAGVAAMIAAWVAPALGVGVPLLLHNTGSSMPLGFYAWHHAAPAAKGEVVVLRDLPHFAWSWLMKRVEGTAGELFCWRPELGTHTLNDRVMPPPDPAALELGLVPWRGCRRLAAGELVGYGQSPDSYDSRYLGPIEEAQLWGVYRPVWVEQEVANPAPGSASQAGCRLLCRDAVEVRGQGPEQAEPRARAEAEADPGLTSRSYGPRP
jgi:type IV secretory pathway protease TraF